MQEIAVKKQEIVKINGKRVLVNGDQVKVLSKEDESKAISRVLDEVYAKELGLWTPISSYNENGDLVCQILDIERRVTYKVYPKFIRPIVKPENYGLENKEDTAYYIHFNGTIAFLLERKGGYWNSVKDITDEILDGKLIK